MPQYTYLAVILVEYPDWNMLHSDDPCRCLNMHETLCPSGLRGWTQVPLARAAWVQIPQVSYLIVWLCLCVVSISTSLSMNVKEF